MGLPPDADGELPQKEEAARAPQVRCARAQCIPGAAVILATSPVAKSAADSTIDARFGRALYTVVLCVHARTRAVVRAPNMWATVYCEGRSRNNYKRDQLYKAVQPVLRYILMD